MMGTDSTSTQPRTTLRKPSTAGTRPRGHLAALLAALLLAVLPGQAQESDIPAERTFSGRAQVTAVDLVIDVRDEAGRVPADLSPEDFEVLEDGEPVPVIGVERFSRGAVTATTAPTAAEERVEEAPSAAEEPAWTYSTVIYFDQVLSGTGSIRRGAQSLAAQAGRLTDLGTVEIVAADPFPRQLLAPTRSARLVEQRLLQVSRELAGRDAIRQVRRQFFDHLRTQGELGGTRQGSAARAGINTDRFDVDRSAMTFRSVFEESNLLADQQDRLLVWAAGYSRPGPRALLMVNDGYDLDPRDFYLVGVESLKLRSELGSESQAFSTQRRLEELSRTLAADGWVTVNLALGNLSGGFFGAEVSGRGRLGNVSGAGSADATEAFPTEIMTRPLDPLKHLAEETGGEVVTARKEIPAALERLTERIRLTYQVERLPDGELHRVEVRPRRPGIEVKAPEWAGSSAPEALAAARGRRLLEGNLETGGLPVIAAVAVQEGEKAGAGGRSRGTLQARLRLAELPEGTLPSPTALRVTLSVGLPDQHPFVRHDVVRDQRLAGLEAWTYTLPVSLPSQAEKIAVVVEDLTTGAWGGALAAEVSGPLPEPPEGRVTAGVTRGGETRPTTVEERGFDVPVDLLPDPKVVVLVPPAGELLTGRVRFDTLVTRPGVERVEFLLDGEPVTLVGKAPFETRVDLGDVPRPRTVEAVAYDASGEELGRDSVVVNEGAGSFRVRLIEPRRADRVGPVDVEAEVRLRADDELDRVEISWNDERVATLYEPPFRQRVRVPPESPVGYIAVTAFLEDGTRAEDVIFMNGPGGDERVEVELVELFTVVTDPSGRPIQGLTEQDFEVLEDGRVQQVTALRDASEMPLSLGLLLDSSASMADDLRRVETAAIDFLYLTLEPGQDRAFLVDFDSEPRLVQPMTGELDEVARKAVKLRPDGYTALCDALVFSLVQMQTVKGRRALVVLSDGVGREERVGYATCRRVAQQVGVPIYAVVLDREGEERERADRIEGIVSAVGGRVFYVEDLENLGSVYRGIRDELESQYLVTYYPKDAGGEDFRRVDVRVLQPGLTARSVAGYWP